MIERKAIGAVMPALMAAALAYAALPAHAKTLKVDDDGKAQFSTIQAAVAAAVAGDTIKVAPGNYQGPVVVTKTLKLVGAQEGEPATSKKRFATAADPLKESVVTVQGNGAVAFVAATSNVRIAGFYLSGQGGASGTQNQVGIATSQSESGYEVLNNVVAGFNIGVYLNSTTTDGTRPSVVTGNALGNNNQFGSVANGVGVASNQGLRFATISKNLFTGNLSGQIALLSNDGTTRSFDVSIKDNVVDADQSQSPTGAGFVISAARRVTIDKNTLNKTGGIPGFPVTGSIFIVGGVSDSRIRINKVTGGSGVGIGLTNFLIPVRNLNNEISGNSASGKTGAGIAVIASDNNLVERNEVFNNNVSGIALVDGDNNLVRANKAYENRKAPAAATPAVGINVNADSAGNTITQNRMQMNDLDAADASTGAGTAGTANTWTKNRCDTSSPAGLCP